MQSKPESFHPSAPFLMVAAATLFCWPALSQTAVGPVSMAVNPNTASVTPVNVPKGPERLASYVLGPDDQIIIHAFQADELSNKQLQIGGDGSINLPLVGRLQAGGLTISQLEATLCARLSNFVREPQVTVFVAEYHSQPVSVVGEVANPGVIQLKGRKTLVEVIAMAGGLRPDASNMATLTRDLSVGRLPLPGAADDPSGKYSIAHVNLHEVMDAQNPRDNVPLEANDVLMIPKAPLLYIVGQVNKPGGYPISERNSVSVLQAVALAGGLSPGAAPKKARILSEIANSKTRTEVATNVQKILDGKAPDIELHENDILFIPNNLPKSLGGKALDTAMNMAGIAVWRF